jgi:hypothetical protein
MKNDLRMYGQEFNPNVIKDVNELNKEIEKETDQEKLMNLRLKRLYRGMELNTNLQQRSFRTLYPY